MHFPRLVLSLLAALLLAGSPGYAADLPRPEIQGSSTLSNRETADEPESDNRAWRHELELDLEIPEFNFLADSSGNGEFSFEGELRRRKSGSPVRVSEVEDWQTDLRLNFARSLGQGESLNLQLSGTKSGNRRAGARGNATSTDASTVLANLSYRSADLPDINLARRFNNKTNWSGRRSRTRVVADALDANYRLALGGFELGRVSYSFQGNTTAQLSRDRDTRTENQRFSFSTSKELLPWLEPRLRMFRQESTSRRPAGSGFEFRDSRRDGIRLDASGELPVTDASYSFRFNDEKTKHTERNFSDERTVNLELAHPIPRAGSGKGNASLAFRKQTSARRNTLNRARRWRLRANSRITPEIPLRVSAERRHNGGPRGVSNPSLRHRLQVSSELPLIDPVSLSANWRFAIKERSGGDRRNENRRLSLSTQVPLDDGLRLRAGYERSISSNSPRRLTGASLKTDTESWNARLDWNPTRDLSASLNWRMNDTATRTLESQETDVRLNANYRIDSRRSLNGMFRLTRNSSVRPIETSATRTSRFRVTFNYSL